MSTTTIELNEKTYGQLLGRTLPHVIRTEEECERLTNELMRLDEREDLSREEKELAELLTVLIDEYEQRRYPIRKANPQQTLQHLMEARKLTQKDLWKVFGSKGITSEVFHGKRSISKAQARKLAEFFHVNVELFI
ncbi:MAG TPA: transcriptional regulator [Candidatus Dormibacteraeota bacterium]|nr:transcriptional regulator [Candidatus Dormibacteraeota bacterium]